MWGEEYEKKIPKSEQDELIKNMSGLSVSSKRAEREADKSLSSNIDGEVWEYVKLLSSKLDDDCIENLHRDNVNTPIVNLMAHMLSNHRLRTSYDFEVALDRVMSKEADISHDCNVKWNFNLLNMIGGSGTAASVIFELKEKGNFRGLKRRKQKILSPKCTKVARSEKITLTTFKSPKFKIVKDIEGGSTLSIKSAAGNNPPCHEVKTVVKNVKVGRSQVPKTPCIRTSCNKTVTVQHAKSKSPKNDCQILKSLNVKVNEGVQLGIGGFLINKDYTNRELGKPVEIKQTIASPRTPVTGRRRLKCVNSPSTGQGSIQKFLRSREAGCKAGARPSPDGMGVESLARYEKASSQVGHQADQTNQLMPDSSALNTAEATSQETDEVDIVDD